MLVYYFSIFLMITKIAEIYLGHKIHYFVSGETDPD